MEAGCKARFPYKTGNDGIRKCGKPELIGPIKGIGDNAQITFFAFVNPPIHYKFLLYPI